MRTTSRVTDGQCRSAPSAGTGTTTEGDASQRAAFCRSKRYQRRLRAGMPQAVIAEIGPRRRIVGTKPLHAIGDTVAATGHHGNGTVIGVAIVVIRVVVALIIVARSAIVSVGVGGERATDHGACDRRARPEAAAVMTIAAAATVPGGMTAVPVAAAAVKARRRCAGRKTRRGRAAAQPHAA